MLPFRVTALYLTLSYPADNKDQDKGMVSKSFSKALPDYFVSFQMHTALGEYISIHALESKSFANMYVSAL